MIQDMIKDRVKSLRDANADDILEALGFERRRTALEVAIPGAVMLGAGIIIGAGIALLLAPKSGTALRRDLKNKASELTSKISETANDVAQEVRGALPFGEADKPGSQHQGKRDTHENSATRSGEQRRS